MIFYIYFKLLLNNIAKKTKSKFSKMAALFMADWDASRLEYLNGVQDSVRNFCLKSINFFFIQYPCLFHMNHKKSKTIENSLFCSV